MLTLLEHILVQKQVWIGDDGEARPAVVYGCTCRMPLQQPTIQTKGDIEGCVGRETAGLEALNNHWPLSTRPGRCTQPPVSQGSRLLGGCSYAINFHKYAPPPSLWMLWFKTVTVQLKLSILFCTNLLMKATWLTFSFFFLDICPMLCGNPAPGLKIMWKVNLFRHDVKEIYVPWW